MFVVYLAGDPRMSSILLTNVYCLVISEHGKIVLYSLANCCLWSSHDGTRMVAHRDVQPTSLKKYGLVVTCLICFVFRCFEGWECSYSMKLTTAQTQACERLKGVLVKLPANDVEDEIGFDDDWFDDEEMEDSDDEDEYSELENGEGTEAQLSSLSSLVENPVQQCVLDLLISLFTHLSSGSDDKFYSPIHRFLVLFSLRKDGQWLAGRRITQLFAALLFCGREVIMALMHHKVMENSGLRYSE